MKRSLKVGTKIFLSLGIMVAGFIVMGGLSLELGWKMRHQLKTLGNSLIPAVTQSKLALNTFSDHLQLYQDAFGPCGFLLSGAPSNDFLDPNVF